MKVLNLKLLMEKKIKKKMDNLEWRMYGLVPYNISDIQKGIQFGHGVVEYGLEHSDHVGYEKWSQKDKTFIILNGGTTNKDMDNLGTLNLKLIDLYAMGVKCSVFTEPDLGNQLTAITFLLDERVWDIEKYPSPPNVSNPIGTIQPDVSSYIENMGGEYVYNIRKFIFNHKLA